MNRSWIEIDGSEGEGGGQMLRSSLALSVLTQQPVRFVRIRAKRAKPGLHAQHLASLRAAAEICQAQVTGDQLGSSTVSFDPGPVTSGDYTFQIGTAGAIALVLHTIYLPLLLKGQGPSTLHIEGGTHALMAPSAEFLITTWAGHLQSLGCDITVEMIRPGFFPRGGGLIQAVLQPIEKMQPLQAMELISSSDDVICLAILGGRLPRHIGERIIHQAQLRLGSHCQGQVVCYPQAKSEGVLATIMDRRTKVPSTFFAHGERGKPSEKVADEACDQYLTHNKTGCPIDPHSADQLLLPLAFASEPSAFRVSQVTQHLLTQRDVIGRFLARTITIHGERDQPGVVNIS